MKKRLNQKFSKNFQKIFKNFSKKFSKKIFKNIPILRLITIVTIGDQKSLPLFA